MLQGMFGVVLTASVAVLLLVGVLGPSIYRSFNSQSPYGYDAGLSNNYPPNYQNNEDENCTICLSGTKGKSSRKLRCNHVFHSECIANWLKENRICPNCRKEA